MASLPAAAQQGTLTACSNPYPRTAPYVLQKKAEQYAKKVVGKDGKSDPTEIRGGPTGDLVFWAIADAVAPDQVKRASERFKKIDLLLLQTQTEAETKSTDKQTGAGAKAQGSTSAVEKPDFPKLLSLAIENGTIQQESNGSTLTLSSSPYAFVAARQGDTAEVYRDNHDLTNIGASATFNITNADVPLANATRRQLAEWSVKYRFFDRSSRSQEFQNKWNQTVLPILVKAAQSSADQLAILNDIHTGKGLAAAYDGLFGYVRDYLGIHQGTSADLLVAGLKEEILCRLGADIHDATEVVEAALSPGDVASPGNSGALKVTLDKNTRQKIQMSIVTSLDLDTQVEQAHSAAEDILKAMQQKPLLTFVYTNVRGTTTPSYSVTKFLLEKNTSANRKLVFNAGASFYGNPDRTKNEQTVRDYAAALSWEAQLGRSPLVLNDVDQGQVTLSFAGRYQRLLENRHQAGKKADLAVVQVKFEIPVFSGVSFPISVSYATASELLKEDHVHANFGFSFDTDKLYQLLAFKKKQDALQ